MSSDNGSSSNLLENSSSYVYIMGWFFLPEIVTRVILFVLRGFNIFKKPQKGSPLEKKQYRNVLSFIIVGYLLLSFTLTVKDLAPSNYEILNTNPASPTFERDIKTAFRKLSLQNHPDKVSQRANGQAVEIEYLQSRKAYEALKDDMKRSISNKFSEEVVNCSHCKTERDYMMYGIPASISFYVIMVVFLGIMQYSGNSQFQVWRIFALACCACLELYLVTHTFDYSGASVFNYMVHLFFPYKTIHQKMQLIQHLVMAVFIALNQLSAYWFPKVASPLTETTAEITAATDSLVDLSNAITLNSGSVWSKCFNSLPEAQQQELTDRLERAQSETQIEEILGKIRQRQVEEKERT